MKETIAPVTSAVANGTSVSYSYSPSLQGSADILADSFSNRPNPMARDRSLFLRQGDYWTICYQGQIVLLKATRGLHYLALLLRNPGREFHVSDLAGHAIGKRLALGKDGHTTRSWRDPFLSDAGPVLDAQAKAQYKHRLDDLRGDLEEAERFNDTARAERVRSEMDAFARQLALAVGLGGRNRRMVSEAERARSAVTKRIKNSINRIGEAIPSLRRHLAARIKTGYFCSYNPQPERPVGWTV